MAIRPYVIRQGDYLTQLAYVLGFDADEVWGHEKNAELKSKRDPNLLLPGDVLWLPDTDPTPLALTGGTTNAYAATIPEITVHLVFMDEGAPIANEPCVILGLGEPQQGSTDGDGALEVNVPVTLHEFQVSFPGPNTLHLVRIGDMDPVEESSGVRKRLRHLGYYYNPTREEPSAAAEVELEARDRRAIAAFQQANGLDPTGVPDDATRAALVQSHGS